MNKRLSLVGGFGMACAAAMVSADSFLDLEPNYTNNRVVLPLFTDVDTDVDGVPDKLSMRLNIYTANTKTKQLSTKPKAALYPSVPCASASSVTREYAERFAGPDGQPYRLIVVDMVTRCVESVTGAEKEAHRAVLYGGNINNGNAWLKNWNGWGVVGSSEVDWDADSTVEIQLLLDKDQKGRMLFVRMSNGTVEADNNYKIDNTPAPSGIGLTSADEPAVTPCPSQNVLTNATEFAALKAAFLDHGSTLTYLDVPFNGSDPDIYKKKCGLEGYWNPADNTDQITTAFLGVTRADLTLMDLLSNGNAGICATGFNNGSFGTGEGFPTAGTYRKELKVASGGTTYHVRFRVAASGSAAGSTFTSEGIDANAIQNTVVYKVNGTTTAYAGLVDAVFNGFASAGAGQLPATTYTVQKTAGGPVIFTATTEMICATKQ